MLSEHFWSGQPVEPVNLVDNGRVGHNHGLDSRLHTYASMDAHDLYARNKKLL